MPSKVWASAANAPLIICSDGSGPETDTGRGDLNWDFGINFRTLDHLAGALQKLDGPIDKLAICAHGSPGFVDVDSVFPSSNSLTQSATDSDAEFDRNQAKCLSVQSFESFRQSLTKIGNKMKDGGVITFMSCNMASGNSGTDLLLKLSKEVWSKVAVTGFTRIGTKTSKIGLNSCDLPGMKFGLDNYSSSTSQK